MRRELHDESLAHVTKIQKEQMIRKRELTEAQRVADRKSTQDSIVYNRKMDAEERYKQQVISKRTRDVSVYNNQVNAFFTLQPGERLIYLFV